MGTFLSLCADLARESGGTAFAPSAVTNQTGRQLKIVNWIAGAWTQIQNLNPFWSFLRTEFTSALVPGTMTYLPAAFSITDMGEWLNDYGAYQPFTIYSPVIGVADEGPLRQYPYERWKSYWGRGVQTNQRPTEYSLAPDGSFRVGGPPDLAYVIKGEYRKTPQTLSANTDVPIMPARFHAIIVWRAIKMMAESDEAVAALQMADDKYREMLVAMERDLLPPISAQANRPLA